MSGFDPIDHYERFYSKTDHQHALWREMTATAKSRHIAEMWSAAGFGLPCRSVLDVGCGDGAVSAALLGTGFAENVRGLEISARAIENAKSRGLHRAEFATMPVGNIPEKADAYDLVVLSHVVEHVEDPRGLVREAVRVGRTVFIEVPLEYTLRLPQHFVWTDTGHINFYTRKLMRLLLESVGVEVLAERSWVSGRDVYRHRHGMVCGTFKWLIVRLLSTLPSALSEALVVHQGGFLVRKADSRR